ncbi:NADH dehydrogenase [ubiquinone] 1 beta subcomplex subunit 8, mitochondrial [Cimex lectularius]|uniref:NADH dehydrogenase [ubiquinone] 1 beta subcomplex subunit 8, mitochondrial n=1 Tax=Cimex lectularius TaxID=79782 RepID=A0A8I6SB48_CIMLE|nr:NADH dehydrogenase [ubiquinone] 1 beta subcomplex subunit 8, mitochondrial [Cimex lectularius]
MSVLKGKLLYQVARRSICSGSALRAAWNKDWMPGPYPKTEEERLAAAKKYNLLPQEYKPIDDDGYGAGDYPDFKPYSVESRDPFYPWDFPEYRRNFGEALHEDFNMYTEDRLDISKRERLSAPVMGLMFLGTLTGFYLINVLCRDLWLPPALPKQLPAHGVKHYMYEGTAGTGHH